MQALGAVIGAECARRILKRDFKFAAAKFKAEHFLEPFAVITTTALPSGFPLEHTRLRPLLWATPGLIVVTCGYGFTLVYPSATQREGWILLPLLLQFIIAGLANATCEALDQLVSDLWPTRRLESYSASNLFRYIFAAAGVALNPVLVSAVGIWSTFVAWGIMIMIFVPLPVIHWYLGSRWRHRRETGRIGA
jgi:hypothetical protein